MSKDKKETFVCSLCNKEYESLRDRIHCESNCLHRLEVEERKARKELEEKEKNNKIAEIEEQIKFLKENETSLYSEYVATNKKRKEYEQKLSQLKYGENYVRITGFPFDFFSF